jgi:hypothetical protein
MEELNKLVGALKENIDPVISEKLLLSFASMTPEAQERVLKGLRQDAEIRKLMDKYHADRAQAVSQGLTRMHGIERNYAEKRKMAVKQLEDRTVGSETEQAKALLNQL